MALLIDEADYAVVDLETTGLSPKYRHRIIEIAVVRLSPRGRVVGEYVTLVNPERDLGPTSIHGITGVDVRDAPTFREIAGDVIPLLEGAVITGHNVRFDIGFLAAEYERLEQAVPAIPSLCTLRLASHLAGGLDRYRLSDCCEEFGIPHEGRHTALGDARATAQLVSHLLDAAISRGLESLDAFGCSAPSSAPWPDMPPSGLTRTREGTAVVEKAQMAYMRCLLDRMSMVGDAIDPDQGAYLEVLEKVLEDRIISEDEGEELLQVAMDLGLSAEDVRSIHSRYVAALATSALQDEVVTESEYQDLRSVTLSLGMPEEDLAKLLEGGCYELQDPAPAGKARESLEGKSVCFTGALCCRFMGAPISRELAEELSRQEGLRPHPGVTKALDILVVADRHSLSGKARKARAYGTRIMAEAVFWRTLGVEVE